MEMAPRPTLPCPHCEEEIGMLDGRGGGLFVARPCGHMIRVMIGSDRRSAVVEPA